MADIVPIRKPPVQDNQLDLFAPAFSDIAFRDQQDLMQCPLCSLSKKPRHKPIKYVVGEKWIEITANSKYGMATIYDHDILIWAASQIKESQDRGHPTSPRLVFHPYRLLKDIRRSTGGKDYKRAENAIRRLTGTLIETNIRPENLAKTRKGRTLGFHLLSSFGFMREENADDDRWFIELPAWIYYGILNNKLVLTIHPDYFLLDSGLDRFLYRTFRKHAGHKNSVGWAFTMPQLYAKSGSAARFSDFARDIRNAIARQAESQHIPEFVFSIEKNGDGETVVYGTSRYQLAEDDPRKLFRPHVHRRVGGGFTVNKYALLGKKIPQKSSK